jgi:hypothetical protein
MRALGFVPKNVDDDIDKLARASVARFQAYQIKKGYRVPQEEIVRNIEFHTTFLKGLNASINKKLDMLNAKLVEYQDELYKILVQKKQELVNLRRVEKSLTKLEKEAREHSLFMGLCEGVIRTSKNFVKNSIKTVGNLTIDLLTGEVPLSLDGILNRLADDFSELAMTTLSETLNVVLTEALIAAQQIGGVVCDSIVFLASAASEIINVACSGPVRDTMESAKWVADATMATPGTALASYSEEVGQDISKAIVDDMNTIAKPYNIANLVKQGDFEKPPKALEDAIDNIKMEDVAKVAAKEGLASAGTAFPPLKVGAAVVSSVATIYGSFCDNVSDMPILQTLEDSSKDANQSIALDKNKVAKLEKEADESFQKYQKENQAIISNLNNQTATMMEIVQYSFTSTWLMKSCWQLKDLRSAFPYMSNDQVITLYFSRIGDSDLSRLKSLLTSNMFSFLLKGIWVFVSEEINGKQETCPLIDQELATLLNQRWGLTRSNYCQHMSRLEVRQMIEEYQDMKATISVPKKTTETLEQFVARNRSLISERIDFFKNKYFREKNLFKSFAIDGRDVKDSSLSSNSKLYYQTKLNLSPKMSNVRMMGGEIKVSKDNSNLKIATQITFLGLVAITTFYVYKKRKR